MRIGVVAGLPSDVARFEPVLRLLGGSEFLLPSAHRPCPRFDARAAAVWALARHGREALVEPSADFDLVLARDTYAPQHLSGWLAPSGRVVAWRDPGHRPRLLGSEPWGLPTQSSRPGILDTMVAAVDVAFAAVASEAWRLHPPGLPEVVTGDPLAHGFFDVGAAARALGALGLSQNPRPIALVLVESTRGASVRWAERVASLRGEFEVVFSVAEPVLLDVGWQLPSAWRGPGFRWASHQLSLSLADLLAAASIVLGDPGSGVRLSHELGVPTVTLTEGRLGHGARGCDLTSGIDGLRICDDPDRLDRSIHEALAESRVADACSGRNVHRDAARRLADRLCAAAQLLSRS